MTVYPTFPSPASPNWPLPIEPIRQMLATNEAYQSGWKRYPP